MLSCCSQFGWTHVTLLIVVTQSHLIIHNLFEGMIWWVLTCTDSVPLNIKGPLLLRSECILSGSKMEREWTQKLLFIYLNRFIVPISCVICNDIMAYMFGFFFGRTPLIKVRWLTATCLWLFSPLLMFITIFNCKRFYNNLWIGLLQLSPKKTWEGFIGGFFATVVFGILVRS